MRISIWFRLSPNTRHRNAVVPYYHKSPWLDPGHRPGRLTPAIRPATSPDTCLCALVCCVAAAAAAGPPTPPQQKPPQPQPGQRRGKKNTPAVSNGLCPKGHLIERRQMPSHVCDLCMSEGTAARCSAGCDYDLFTPCPVSCTPQS